MNSEKVKEIKECLQSCNDDKIACYDCKYYEKCEKILTKNNILTLINELEECSKKWQKLCADEVALNKPLKDRIAELECLLSKKTMEYELLKCGKKIGDGIVEVIDEAKKSLATYEALKQFAERLKDRLRYTSPTSDVLELSGLVFDGIEVEQSIDETLKEFIK